MKTLLLVGATGLVGDSVLAQALADPRVGKVVAPTRRPLLTRPRLENPVVDFGALPADARWWATDGVICTLGTTIRKAGSREAFRKVDHDYPLAVAALARQHGATAYALTSSIGASVNSSAFYLRTKGETERALESVGFPSLTIVRPSFIGGDRQEPRPMERIALGFFGGISQLLPRRWRVISAERIARCLIDAALIARPGVHVVESEAI